MWENHGSKSVKAEEEEELGRKEVGFECRAECGEAVKAAYVDW